MVKAVETRRVNQSDSRLTGATFKKKKNRAAEVERNKTENINGNKHTKPGEKSGQMSNKLMVNSGCSSVVQIACYTIASRQP